jgi:hypothetical protein
MKTETSTGRGRIDKACTFDNLKELYAMKLSAFEGVGVKRVGKSGGAPVRRSLESILAMLRDLAEQMPRVTVLSRPKGDPIAMTQSPDRPHKRPFC